MSQSVKTFGLFGLVALLILGTGFVQSWNSALLILNMGLVSALMALGVNLQWGFAGLFNVGVMGFVALGGLATVVIAMPPVRAAWAAGASGVLAALAVGALTLALAVWVTRRMARGWPRALVSLSVLVAGFVIYRALFDPAVAEIERIDPALTGYLGGACRWCWPGRWAGCWPPARPG